MCQSLMMDTTEIMVMMVLSIYILIAEILVPLLSLCLTVNAMHAYIHELQVSTVEVVCTVRVPEQANTEETVTKVC
jgi:hypothetical protein